MEMDALIKGLLTQVAELKKQFQIEMDAKNEAYDFIISNGHLQQYNDWQLQHTSENHHLNCIIGLMAHV